MSTEGSSRQFTLSRDDSCLPNYIRCVINTWRISYGWLRLINKMSLTASIVLTSLATLSELDISTQTKIGIAAVICESIAFFCGAIYDYAGEAVTERKKLLSQIREEEGNN